MRLQCRHIIVVVVCALVLGPAARGMSTTEPNEVDRDRASFNQLVREIHQVNGQARTLMAYAVGQARRENGQVSLETKARLLSLRDRRDRLVARMLVISARHDWDIPDFKRRPARIKRTKEPADRVFGPIDVLIRRRLTREAHQIVEMVPLPVVSLERASR